MTLGSKPFAILSVFLFILRGQPAVPSQASGSVIVSINYTFQELDSENSKIQELSHPQSVPY